MAIKGFYIFRRFPSSDAVLCQIQDTLSFWGRSLPESVPDNHGSELNLWKRKRLMFSSVPKKIFGVLSWVMGGICRARILVTVSFKAVYLISRKSLISLQSSFLVMATCHRRGFNSNTGHMWGRLSVAYWLTYRTATS